MSIRIEGLTHTYMPNTPFQATAIHDIDLTVGDGDFLGLIGHTGSGKTTLVMHMNALLKPTAGRVLVDGQDIHDKNYDRREVRRRVGLVFQYPEHQLFEETVAKDVAFGPKNLGVSATEAADQAREAIERVGLSFEEIAERSPFDLSGGQMRRVAIAGVLAMRPETLVLDEPTAGLDPAGRRDILALVQRLHAEGVTVIMVSHSMEDIAQLATRIAVMNGGRLAMVGTPGEVFAEGDALAAMGLDVPAAVKLKDMLRAKGMPVPEEIYQMPALTDWLARQGNGGAKP
jgi:energy-coupling factor transport system ATP-binding protein